MTETSQASPAMLEFLRWVDASDRSYSDAMEAWQTSCPRFSTWEDANIGGYVVLSQGPGETMVRLSERGRAILEAA